MNTHISFITFKRRRREKFARRKTGLRRIKSRVEASLRGYCTQAVRSWFVRSSDKDGQRLLSTAWTDKDRQTAKTRDSRGSGRYQPPSLGPEDGNLYTTKKPSR